MPLTPIGRMRFLGGVPPVSSVTLSLVTTAPFPVRRKTGQREGRSAYPAGPRKNWSVVGSAAEALRLAAALLVVQPAPDRRLARLGRPPLPGRWCDRLPQQHGQPLPRGLAVAPLRFELRGRDRHHSVDQPRLQPLERPSLEYVAQRRRTRHVEAQLDPAVPAVHRLSAGPAGPREPPPQLRLGNHHPRPHLQSAVHTPIRPEENPQMDACVFCGLISADSARWIAQEDAAVAFLPS